MPERFELGTLPYELLAGVTAAVDFIAGLAPGLDSRRPAAGRGSLESMAAVEEYEAGLFDRLLDGLGAIDGVTLHGRRPGVPRPSCSRWPATPGARSTSSSPGSG